MDAEKYAAYAALQQLVCHIKYANGGEMRQQDVESMVRIEVESHGTVELALEHYEKMNGAPWTRRKK